MVNTRARSHNETGGATNSVTNQNQATAAEVTRPAQATQPPPLIPQIPPFGNTVTSVTAPRMTTIPPLNLGGGGVLMTEAGSQDEFQIRLLQAMNTMMEQQHETMMKMFEERDASYRRHEATAENIVGGSGARVVIPTTEETPVVEVRRAGRSCSYKDFMCTKPPEFFGTENPVMCMRWLRGIEQAFGSSDCEERQKVKYASQMLRGRALEWWSVTVASIGPTIVAMLTWEMFKAKVMEEYCSEREMDRIADEFRALKKGDKTVREYTGVFMEKLGLVSHVAPTEKEKIKAYIKGLPSEMMELVRMSKPSTLREAIEEAQFKEDARKLSVEEKNVSGEKRKWESNPMPSKRPSFNNNNNRGFNSRQEPRW